MTNLKFDDFVKEQFSGYSPDVPPHIWENIAEKRKKRRPAGFWINLLNRRNMLLLAVLLAGGSGGAWLLTRNNTAEKNNSPVITASNENSNKIKDPAGNTAENNSTLPSGIQDPASSIGDPSSLNKTSQNISTAQQALPVTTSVYSPLPFLPPANPVAADRKRKRSSLTTVNGNQTDIANGQEEDLNENMAGTVTDDPSALPASGTLMGRLLYTAEKLRSKKAAGLPAFDQDIHAAVFPKCPKIDAPSGNQQYFDIYAGPDIALRSFNDTGNSAYLQKRKESEKFSSAYSAGARYTRVFNNGISLRTGVNYSQINEKFTYVKGGIIQYVYILDQATGDTIGSYSVSGTRYKTSYNRYRTVDIPLQMGYEMGNGRLHANMAAGVMVNIYSWQRGDVLDTSLAPVNITTGKSTSPYGFKTNTGVGFLGSVTLYYKLTTNTDEPNLRLVDRMHLLLEPYFRYNLKPMSKENFTLTQKYSTAGLRLGVRIDIK